MVRGWMPGIAGAGSVGAGLKGTIVADYLQIADSPHYHRDIKAVLERVEKCARLGQKYDGKLADEPVTLRLGRRLIPPGLLRRADRGGLHGGGHEPDQGAARP